MFKKIHLLPRKTKNIIFNLCLILGVLAVGFVAFNNEQALNTRWDILLSYWGLEPFGDVNKHSSPMFVTAITALIALVIHQERAGWQCKHKCYNCNKGFEEI